MNVNENNLEYLKRFIKIFIKLIIDIINDLYKDSKILFKQKYK